MIGRSMVPTYLRYIVPSMIAFTLTSIYGIVDGLFVGNVVGDAGLAGINVSFPLVQFVFAVGTGIGMGGAVISSIRAGRGDEASSRRAVGNTLLMLVVASLPLMAVLLMFGAPLSELLGGRGATLAEAVNYITVIAWGTPFLVLQVGCLPLIRNRGHVNYAMGVSVLSGLVNVALDWLFVVELHAGTAGAAAATVIAQALAFALCAAFFLRKGERIALRDFKPQARTIGHALKLGMAPFGLTLLPEVTVVAVNMNAVVQGGEVAVAAYAVISYTAMIIQMLIQGVGDGSQPLVSRSYGAGRYAEARAIRTTNYVITVTIGVLGLAAMYLLREQVPAWFGASADTTQLHCVRTARLLAFVRVLRLHARFHVVFLCDGQRRGLEHHRVWRSGARDDGGDGAGHAVRAERHLGVGLGGAGRALDAGLRFLAEKRPCAQS